MLKTRHFIKVARHLKGLFYKMLAYVTNNSINKFLKQNKTKSLLGQCVEKLQFCIQMGNN